MSNQTMYTQTDLKILPDEEKLRQLDRAPEESQRATADALGISLGRLNAQLRAVVAAGLVQTKDDVLQGLERCGGDAAARELLQAIPGEVLNRGGSLIAAPDASVVAQAGEGEEMLFAELDLSLRDEALASLDTDGHYSRPDVFELSVDTRAKDGVNWDGY